MTNRAKPASEKVNFFDKLGALVERRWADENFDNSRFAGVALAALEEMPPSEHAQHLQIVQWVIAADRLPPQDLESRFGEPPLTLYKSDLFYIQALFWLDAPTVVHEHSFAGAFHVLEGSSLHSRYQFELKERINSRLLVGEVRLRSVECLMKGDSRAILPGRQFSHSTFHLEKPTVTIVIRTEVNEDARPQYSYLRPSIAFDPFAKRSLLTRQLELFNLLHATNEPGYLSLARELLSGSDFETGFWLLEQSCRHLPAQEFASLLELAERRLGGLTKLFPAVFCQLRREAKIDSRCRFMAKPEHRLLLGLLACLPNRASIFKFIRSQFAGDPVELISRWIEEMAGAKVPDVGEPNALGVRFDESSLLIFKSLLEGLSFDSMKERMKQEYDAEDVEAQNKELRQFFSALQSSVLFEPLFAGGQALPFEITGRQWGTHRPSLTDRHFWP
jgi:hypothetical protein